MPNMYLNFLTTCSPEPRWIVLQTSYRESLDDYRYAFFQINTCPCQPGKFLLNFGWADWHFWCCWPPTCLVVQSPLNIIYRRHEQFSSYIMWNPYAAWQVSGPELLGVSWHPGILPSVDYLSTAFSLVLDQLMPYCPHCLTEDDGLGQLNWILPEDDELGQLNLNPAWRWWARSTELNPAWRWWTRSTEPESCGPAWRWWARSTELNPAWRWWTRVTELSPAWRWWTWWNRLNPVLR